MLRSPALAQESGRFLDADGSAAYDGSGWMANVGTRKAWADLYDDEFAEPTTPATSFLDGDLPAFTPLHSDTDSEGDLEIKFTQAQEPAAPSNQHNRERDHLAERSGTGASVGPPAAPHPPRPPRAAGRAEGRPPTPRGRPRRGAAGKAGGTPAAGSSPALARLSLSLDEAPPEQPASAGSEAPVAAAGPQRDAEAASRSKWKPRLKPTPQQVHDAVLSLCKEMQKPYLRCVLSRLAQQAASSFGDQLPHIYAKDILQVCADAKLIDYWEGKDHVLLPEGWSADDFADPDAPRVQEVLSLVKDFVVGPHLPVELPTPLDAAAAALGDLIQHFQYLTLGEKRLVLQLALKQKILGYRKCPATKRTFIVPFPSSGKFEKEDRAKRPERVPGAPTLEEARQHLRDMLNEAKDNRMPVTNVKRKWPALDETSLGCAGLEELLSAKFGDICKLRLEGATCWVVKVEW